MFKKFISMAMACALIFSSVLVAPVYAANGDLTSEQVPLVAWYSAAATDWESQATPLGNGYMGAMLFGDVDKDRILINEKTLWSGGPGASTTYNGGFKDTAE